MKTFADVKRRLVVGAKLVMTRNDWVFNGRTNPLLGIVRKIERRQTDAVQFEPHAEGQSGSWFHFPAASMISIVDANTFNVGLNPEDPSVVMTYIILDEDAVSKRELYKTAVVAKDSPFFKAGTVVSVKYTGTTRGIAHYTGSLNGVEQAVMFEGFSLNNFTL